MTASPLPHRRRLLLVSTNYAPEHAGIGPYATQIAEHWAALGHETHVLTGLPHYPAWRLDPAYARVWRRTEQRAGVLVHRRRHTVPGRQSAAARALFEASVLAHGLLAPPRTGRPDAVVAQLPTLAAGALAARIAARHRVPFVAVVQDLMGAAAAQSGIRGGARAAGLAGRVEGAVLRRAALVGVIHESFREGVERLGVAPDRIRVVPNWTHVPGPARPRDETRARLGWPPGRTVVLHAGNMGYKQGLEVLVDAARIAPELHFVLMGDGSRRDALARRAADLPNATLLPPASGADFPEVLGAADVLAVTQRAAVLDMSVPSKLTSYFAAGRPVVASVAPGGGTAQEVQRSGAGVLVPPEDPGALVATVRTLTGHTGGADDAENAENAENADNTARAAELAAAGPRHVAERLSRAAGLARIDGLVDEVLEGAGT